MSCRSKRPVLTFCDGCTTIYFLSLMYQQVSSLLRPKKPIRNIGFSQQGKGPEVAVP